MFRDSVRIGLIAASLLANLAAGVHTVAPVAAAVATPSAAQSDANLGLAAPNLVGIDPASCLVADWMPQSNTTLIVPRGTITMNFVVTVTSATALDATTAQYTFYAPGNNNIPWTAAKGVQLTDFSVVITAANVPIAPPANGGLPSVQFKVSRKNKAPADTDACSPVQSVFTASPIYLPVIFKDSTVIIKDITTTEEPNNTTCTSYPIDPNVRYISRLNDKEDFYKLNVPMTSTLTLSVIGFDTAGQVQVRRSSGQCDAGTLYNATSFQGDIVGTRVLVVNNVLPGEVYIRIVSTLTLPPNTDYNLTASLTKSTTPTGPFEPNNNACQAYPITSGSTYKAYPEDSSDWYSFTLTGDANVTLNLTNFNVTVGQYILYKSTSCTQVPSGVNPITVQDKATTSFSVGTQSAGTYYLRIAVGSGANASAVYSLRVDAGTSSGTWNPTADICSQLTNCSPNASGGKFTVYWSGNPGMTELRIEFIGKGKTGGCAQTTGGRVVFVPADKFATSGSYEVTGTPGGYWGIQLSAKGSGGTWTRNGDLPLKMDCDFQLANQAELLPTPEPTVIPEVTPVP